MLDFNVNLKLPNPFEKTGSNFIDQEIESAKAYIYTVLHKDEKSFHEYIGMDAFLRFNLIVRYIEYVYFIDLGSQEILDFLSDTIHDMQNSLWNDKDDVPIREVARSHNQYIYGEIRKILRDPSKNWGDWLKTRGRFYREFLSVTYPFFMNKKVFDFAKSIGILQNSDIMMNDKKHGPIIRLISDKFSNLLNHAGREFERISDSFPFKSDRIYPVTTLSEFQTMIINLLVEDITTITPYLPTTITKELTLLGSKF